MLGHSMAYNEKGRKYYSEAQFNEPLYNDVLGITNDILRPSNCKMYAKNDLTKPRYSERSLLVRWPYVLSMFHCIILKTTGKHRRRLVFDAKLDAKKSRNPL